MNVSKLDTRRTYEQRRKDSRNSGYHSDRCGRSESVQSGHNGGQANLLATLAPKNRVEALEDEVAFMKPVVKILSQEVAELKKAQ